MRPWTVAALAGALLPAALPGPATAAGITTELRQARCDRAGCSEASTVVTYTADAGERNQLNIRAEGAHGVLIEDAGASIRPAGPCRARSEHVVACDGYVSAVTADLGDGDVATPGQDAPAPDAFDGGGGRDRVWYVGRTGALHIALAPGAANGAPGEGDRFTAIEEAIGGDGPDRLTGTEGDDSLDGGAGRNAISGLGGNDALRQGLGGRGRIDAGPGDDFVSGGDGRDVVDLGAGDDTVDGGSGRDRIDAGAGDDRILIGRAAAKTRLRCGPGRDTAADVYAAEPVAIPDDCERVAYDQGRRIVLHTPLRSPRSGLGHLRFPCEDDDGCRLRLELRRVVGAPGSRFSRRFERERLLGARTLVVPRRSVVPRLAVRLRPSGRRLLAGRGRLRVRVVLRSSLGRDRLRPEDDHASFLIELLAPRR